MQKKKNPSVLGLKYDQLVAMDTISVDLVPEKKGILLKHNEYRVHSQVCQIWYCFYLLVTLKSLICCGVSFEETQNDRPSTLQGF